MNIATLITTFERWANPRWQEKWDNCGWQVEPGIQNEPAGVLVCLTPTLAGMEEAIALRAQGTETLLQADELLTALLGLFQEAPTRDASAPADRQGTTTG